MTLSGDIDGAVGSSLGSGWAGVAQQVTNWEWNYKSGTNGVKYPTEGLNTPASITNPAGPGRIVANPCGFFGSTFYLGNTSTRLLGAVTILATTPGEFLGGAFHYPGADGVAGTEGVTYSELNGAAYIVGPEPGTGLLLALGLVGVGGARRCAKSSLIRPLSAPDQE